MIVVNPHSTHCAVRRCGSCEQRWIACTVAADYTVARQRARIRRASSGSLRPLAQTVASLGSQYVLWLRATDCCTGSILAEAQRRAERREDVLDVLRQIASQFRSRLGESLTTVEQHDTTLEDATTPSLDTLKAYSAARKLKYTASGYAAILLLKRAVEVDPKFAMEYVCRHLSRTAIF